MRDNRFITPEQNRKLHATVADIAEYEGEPPALTKELFKFWYCALKGIDTISLSNCTVTQARELINIVMDHAIENDIPLKDSRVNRTDDINRYLYMCILNHICCICGKRSVDKVHHATDSRIGIGNNGNKVNHVRRYAIALCRDH